MKRFLATPAAISVIPKGNGSVCPCPSCSEHCDDYLLLLQQLLEAEKVIEVLSFELEALRDQR